MNTGLTIEELSTAEQKAFEHIDELLYNRYGINFELDRSYSLLAKLRRRMRMLELNDLIEYKHYLEQNDAEIFPLLAEVSTNKTFFFREQKHWSFFENKLLPEWKTIQELRVWSAACSTGQEVYSAACLLTDARGFNDMFRVLGTDLSRPVLGKAVRGIYSGSEIKRVREYSSKLAQKYFSQTENGKYQVHNDLRRHTIFRYFNLRDQDYPFQNKFHLVLCRNVLIYFDRPMIQHVIANLTKALQPGGYLFIGHTENLNEIDHQLERVKPAIYRRPQNH